MSAEGYLEHSGYRGKIERGTWVWTRILPRKFVGRHVDSGKEIRLPLSGTNNIDKQRIVTNTSDYEEACRMLDRKLADPPKKPKFKKDKAQVNIFDAIKEAQKDNLIDMMKDDQKDGLYE